MKNLKSFDSFLNEAKIPVYHDTLRKKKEEIEEKDLAGYLTGKLEEIEKEKNPQKRKSILVVVERPNIWEREFVLVSVEDDTIEVSGNDGKEYTFKIKEIVEVYSA